MATIAFEFIPELVTAITKTSKRFRVANEGAANDPLLALPPDNSWGFWFNGALVRGQEQLQAPHDIWLPELLTVRALNTILSATLITID